MKKTKIIQIWDTSSKSIHNSWLISAFLGICEKDTELVNNSLKVLRNNRQFKLSKDELFVFSNQKKRIDSLQGKVDFCISTLPLLSFSKNSSNPIFSEYVKDVSKEYCDINILIKTDTERFIETKEFLEKNNIPFKEFENHPFVSLDILYFLEEIKEVEINDGLKKLQETVQELVKANKINLKRLLIRPKKNKLFNKTINFSFYSGPGGGKSTTSRIFASLLNLNNQSVELIDEVPKEMVWDEEFDRLSDQMFVFSQQNRKVESAQGLYNFTVNDSPLDMQHIFAKLNKMPKEFHNIIDYYQNKYFTVDIFLERVHKYQRIGRIQTEEQSNEITSSIKKFLDDKKRTYFIFKTTPLVSFLILNQFDGIFFEINKDLKTLISHLNLEGPF